MDINVINSPSGVSDEYEKQIQELDELISKLEYKQTCIQKYITDLDIQNNQLEIQITQLDAQKNNNPNVGEIKGKLYGIITKKIELINDLYNTVAQFESVKHRYIQEKNKLTQDRIKLLTIDLKMIEMKMNTNSSDELVDLMKGFKSMLNDLSERRSINVTNHPDLNDPSVSMD